MHNIYSGVHKAQNKIVVLLLLAILTCTGVVCGTKGNSSLLGMASSTKTADWPNLVNIQLLNDKILVQTELELTKKFSVVSLEAISEDWSIETPYMFYNVSGRVARTFVRVSQIAHTHKITTKPPLSPPHAIRDETRTHK